MYNSQGPLFEGIPCITHTAQRRRSCSAVVVALGGLVKEEIALLQKILIEDFRLWSASFSVVRVRTCTC